MAYGCNRSKSNPLPVLDFGLVTPGLCCPTVMVQHGPFTNRPVSHRVLWKQPPRLVVRLQICRTPPVSLANQSVFNVQFELRFDEIPSNTMCHHAAELSLHTQHALAGQHLLPVLAGLHEGIQVHGSTGKRIEQYSKVSHSQTWSSGTDAKAIRLARNAPDHRPQSPFAY